MVDKLTPSNPETGFALDFVLPEGMDVERVKDRIARVFREQAKGGIVNAEAPPPQHPSVAAALSEMNGINSRLDALAELVGEPVLFEVRGRLAAARRYVGEAQLVIRSQQRQMNRVQDDLDETRRSREVAVAALLKAVGALRRVYPGRFREDGTWKGQGPPPKLKRIHPPDAVLEVFRYIEGSDPPADVPF